MDEVKHAEIIIARHGNTFDPGDEVLRCGARTDLPLSSSGRRQAIALGRTLGHGTPEGFDAVYVSTLRRTQETAQLALAAMGQSTTPIVDERFNEIDYGPDEGLPESQVQARLGLAALSAWDDEAIVPPGWLCDPQAMRHVWRAFFARIEVDRPQRTLIVTSNGVARFALAHPNDVAGGGKLSTGAYGIFVRSNGKWKVHAWNIRPTLGE